MYLAVLTANNYLLIMYKRKVTDFFFLILGISKEVKKILLLNLRQDFPFEVAPVLLAPIIYSDKLEHPMEKINSDTSTIANIMVIVILGFFIKHEFYPFIFFRIIHHYLI
jgi:uncharacterized membrane protein